jgi:membrane-associated phospholipid phosphatase
MAPDGKPSWGEDATKPVGGERLVQAAKDAFLDPQTLIPAAGALIFTIDGLDCRVSHWAIEHTPLFGSKDSASAVSDALLTALTAETVVTALATPSGDDLRGWVDAKAKGLCVEVGALGFNCLATDEFKRGIGRERPDHSTGSMSFPSGHSSGAFATATLANLNLNSVDMPGIVRQGLQVGNLGLASGVAWARVEGGHHFPMDVLAGAALGHFLSAFVHNAFLDRTDPGKPNRGSIDVTITPLQGGGLVSMAFRF